MPASHSPLFICGKNGNTSPFPFLPTGKEVEGEASYPSSVLLRVLRCLYVAIRDSGKNGNAAFFPLPYRG